MKITKQIKSTQLSYTNHSRNQQPAIIYIRGISRKNSSQPRGCQQENRGGQQRRSAGNQQESNQRMSYDMCMILYVFWFCLCMICLFVWMLCNCCMMVVSFLCYFCMCVCLSLWFLYAFVWLFYDVCVICLWF